jgi:hypothetical protein
MIEHGSEREGGKGVKKRDESKRDKEENLNSIRCMPN